MDPTRNQLNSKISYKIVWLIQVKSGQRTFYVTGFALKPNLIVTCEHPFFRLSEYTVRIRRLDKDNQWFEAERFYGNRHCDIALVRSLDAHFYTRFDLIPGFDVDKLYYGDPVLAIDNYNFLLGSTVVGYVAHECFDYPEDDIEGVDMPLETCINYKKPPASNEPLRMGNFWHQHNTKTEDFASELDRRIPVIQIFNFPHCGYGTSPSNMIGAGAPVFNVDGEVVGMMRESIGDSVLAIHCSVLRKVVGKHGENDSGLGEAESSARI